MVKALILDCFGVLYVPLGEDFYRTHIPHYENVRAELVDLGRQADYGLISQDELAARVAELSGLDFAGVRMQIAGRLLRNQGLIDYQQTLRQRFKISVISNMSLDAMDTFFSQNERRELFDDVVISSEVGMIKPHPEIYELAAKRLGVDTTECLMIDDSVQNCDGAVLAGMQAYHYQTTHALKAIIADLA